MVSVNIRRAQKEDCEKIAGNLWLELVKYHEKIEKLYNLNDDATDNYLSFLEDSMEKESCLILVADTGNRLVGFLRAEIENRPPVFKVKKIGNIGDLFVKKE